MKIPNPITSLLGVCLLTSSSMGFLSHAWADTTTMHGRQSHNQGIRAVPAPGPVTIDGDLSDWDFSGRIWSFADIGIRDRFSVETAVMYDDDFLYIAAKFRDTTPLINTIHPDFDPESGWKGDALQLRLRTDWPQWITLWYYGAEDRSTLHHAMWKDERNGRMGQDVTLYKGESGEIDLGNGIQMAFQEDEDGRGYVQEVRIPWSLIYKEKPEITPGLTFQMGLEFFWGSAEESVWPIHRYADNLQEGQTSREFFWTAINAWGDVELQAEGDLEMLTYIPDVDTIEGTIPVEAVIPEDAAEFTIVLETEDGKRVRNLGAQLNPEQYSVSVEDGKRKVVVQWDGLDDTEELAAPGKYQVRGLSHEGLGADYVMSFYNPGTPPWEAGGRGSWGADHGAPQYVAAAGDWTVIGWGFAEGGSGVIGIGPDGLKRWGEKRGVQALAADEKSVYFISRGWHESGNLCRLKRNDGSYKPFVLDGKERPFELPLLDIFGEEVPGEVMDMASSGEALVLAMSEGKLALLDPASAELQKLLDVPAPRAVAFGPDGEIYAISGSDLVEVDVENGDLRKIATPGLELPEMVAAALSGEEADSLPEVAAESVTELKSGTLAVDHDGNIGIFDIGADQQVKFFSPQGEFQYAVGRKGGRPSRGEFDKQAMREVSSVAVDSEGQIWVTENWNLPRRVSVWGRDGELVRDYIGNTGYAATGTFLHDNDPTIAHFGPVEMKLDKENRTWEVTRILWVPEEDEHFQIPTGGHSHPHRFWSSASGKEREYLFAPPYRRSEPHVLFMRGDDDNWRPVAAVGLLGQISGQLERRDARVVAQPDGEFEGHNAWDGYIWNDLNGDGRVQKDEVIIIPNEKPVEVGKTGQLPMPLMSGWGARMSPEDLSFVTNGVARYVPTGFSDDGAPIFGLESIKEFEFGGRSGDYVPVLEENSIIALMWEQYFTPTGLYAIDAETGEQRWSYPNPFPGVHGSHRAPMPQPGLLIGPLMILGVAELPDDNGHVFGMRGNLGQDFYMTTDGLFVGTVFQDGRLPSLPLPPREEELVGAPMESHGGGGEPFTGWFGNHTDGKIRLMSGIPRQAAMILEMNGFDRIQRFTAPAIEVSEKALSEAALANAERAAAAARQEEREHTIPRVATAPDIDGKGTGWSDIPEFEVKSSASNFTAQAQLAYDDENLYIGIDVEDPNPWLNEGVDFARLFKTGDAVDIQLATDQAADAPADRGEPVAGDLRVVIAQLNDKPTAVLMQPVNPDASSGSSRTYVSPVVSKDFDEVRVLPEVEVAVDKKPRGYRLEAKVPLETLGVTPKAGEEILGDIGFISSDADGRINIARTYWSNQATNLVNDEPFEAWLTPARWGTFIWGE